MSDCLGSVYLTASRKERLLDLVFVMYSGPLPIGKCSLDQEGFNCRPLQNRIERETDKEKEEDRHTDRQYGCGLDGGLDGMGWHSAPDVNSTSNNQL